MRVEYLIVKEENSQCKTSEAFLSFLKTNTDLTVGKKEVVYNKFSINYTLKTDKIDSTPNNGRYFILELERKDPTGKRKQEELEKFGEFCKLLRAMIIDASFGFDLIILFDSLSVYYSEKAYPLLNNIENLMRKLIFKFMFMKIGINWLEDATPKEVQDKIKTKGGKNKVKNLLQDSLYEADFIVLVDFLFKPYSTLSQEKLVEKVKAAKQAKDLDMKELKEIIPKSNWDRYFLKFVEIEKLNSKWAELYDLRNKVAHNKPITKSDFDKVVALTDELSEKLITAIGKIDDIKVNEQEKQEVKGSVVSDVFITEKELANFYTSFMNKNKIPTIWERTLENTTNNIYIKHWDALSKIVFPDKIPTINEIIFQSEASRRNITHPEASDNDSSSSDLSK